MTLNKGVVGTLFGLSILTATVRGIYQIKTHRQLRFDDLLLVFACAALTAATGLLYELIPTIYGNKEGTLSTKWNLVESVDSNPELFARILRYRRLVNSFVVLTWVTIFSVKICFLLFFLQLINRVKKLMFIWKVVFAVTMVAFCFCVCGTFIACPPFARDSCKSCSIYFTTAVFPGHIQLTNYTVLSMNLVKCYSDSTSRIGTAITIITATLDIITDLLSES